MRGVDAAGVMIPIKSRYGNTEWLVPVLYVQTSDFRPKSEYTWIERFDSFLLQRLHQLDFQFLGSARLFPWDLGSVASVSEELGGVRRGAVRAGEGRHSWDDEKTVIENRKSSLLVPGTVPGTVQYSSCTVPVVCTYRYGLRNIIVPTFMKIYGQTTYLRVLLRALYLANTWAPLFPASEVSGTHHTLFNGIIQNKHPLRYYIPLYLAPSNHMLRQACDTNDGGVRVSCAE
jgi:hypothetical protein